MSASEQPRRATAVRYDGSTSAPSVIASGRGHVADAILAAARASGIPVREDAVLAHALASLEIGTEIPPELYEAVAQSLVWAYRLTGRAAPAAP